MKEKSMQQVVAVAKSRGFVYPGSEIYGGLANTATPDSAKWRGYRRMAARPPG